MEQVFGTKDVPFAERGMLEVRLPEAVADAFDMVMNYIYTDRINRKEEWGWQRRSEFILYWVLQ